MCMLRISSENDTRARTYEDASEIHSLKTQNVPDILILLMG